MTLQVFRVASVFAAASSLLAGCATGARTQAMDALPVSAGSQTIPMDGQTCQNSDGIKVMPCRVRFDSQHTGARNVEVTSGDNDRQTIKERDDCSARNVATVTRMSNHRYVVAAGPAKGSCTANFTGGMHNDDQGRRGSDLTVVNAR
jgi:hypothetical protein